MQPQDWRLYVHPLLQSQLEKLTRRVERIASSDPRGYTSQPAAKLLATIYHYMREAIPRDPNCFEFRQGNTLGRENRHWFRAKFHRRYRLFYRFSSDHKIIVYVWANDEQSLRKAGSKTDPYTVFRAMLESGEPPGPFTELLKRSKNF